MGNIYSGNKLKAGVIGGRHGDSNAYAYANSEEYELVSVCDLKSEIIDEMWEKARIEKGSVRTYGDYRDMIDAEDLDVVSVSVPDHVHADPVCDASNAGVKGIFCEKPLTINLEDGDRIVETVQKNGTKMSVDHTRSFVPNYRAGRESIRNGDLGGLTRIVAHMGGHRSMLFRNGTHTVDLISYFADSRPKWVIAAHEQGFEDYGTVYKGEGGKDPALDPGSTVIIEYENGVRAILNSAKLTPAFHEIDLIGPSGRVLLDDKTSKRWLADKPEGELKEDPSFNYPGYPDFFGDALIPAVKELAEMILGNAVSSSPPERARDTLEIMLAALISQDQGNTRVSLPLPRN